MARSLALAAIAVASVELQNDSPSLRYTLREIPSNAVRHGHSAAPRWRLWDSTSANWSGYAVPLDTSGVSDTYSQVQGTWTVPGVTGSRSATYLATWVGIDGYTDGSVEQTGTEQDWTGRSQQNYAWFEMYPNPSYEIIGFPVDVGDSISAQVSYVGQTTVTVRSGHTTTTQQDSVFKLTLINNTHNVSYTVPSSYTTIPTVSRDSAEWVAEAPSSGRILTLADYGTVNFSSCNASSLGSGGNAQPISFWPSDPLTMDDPSGGISTPSGLSTSGAAFSTTYTP